MKNNLKIHLKLISIIFFCSLSSIYSQAIAVEYEQVTNIEEKYNVDVVYPKFKGSNSNVEIFNDIIWQNLNMIIEKFRQHVAGKVNGFEPEYIIKHSALKINYQITFNNDYLTSVSFSIDETKFPTTHEHIFKFMSFNFYINKQVPLIVSDCFKPNFRYADYVHNKIYQIITAKFDANKYGYSPKVLKETIFEKPIHNFQLTNEGIVIYFNPNQIVPFFHGLQKILIPYNKAIISDDLMYYLQNCHKSSSTNNTRIKI